MPRRTTIASLDARLLAFAPVLALGCLGCRSSEPPRPSPQTVAQTPEPAKPKPELAPAPPPPPPPHAILDPEIREAREAAQRAVLRDGDPLQPDLPPLPEGPLPGPDQLELDEEGEPEPGAYPGFFAPLHIPEGADPLASFERALSSLEEGKAKGEDNPPVRLAFYGASAVAADLWTGYVRAYLRARFGDGGPGMISAAKPNRWHRHNELLIDNSRHWTTHNSFRDRELPPPYPFGAMGLAMSADSKRAWIEIEPREDSPSATRLERYEIHYLERPEGGGFELKIDGEPVKEIDTAGPRRKLVQRSFDLEPGQAHELRIELLGDGEVWLLGVVAETGDAGIVLDTLGINGAKASDPLRWDEALWAEHLQARAPVLYVLSYGANSSVDEDEPIEQYERDYRELLERFARALPEASCVVVGPGDFPKLGEGEQEGQVLPRPRLNQIREIQRALAAEHGCAFLDLLELYGGAGSMAAWVAAGLGKEDHLHLTREGYLRVGLGVGDALMQRYDWRARQSEAQTQ